MNLTDLSSAVGSLTDLIIEWFEYLRHPLQSCDLLFSKSESEQARTKRAAKIWATSFILAAVVLTPLYNLIGIQFENLGFHVSVFLFQTLNFLLVSIIVHLGFRRYRVNSQFGDTFLLYSLVFSPYYPVLSLLNYPFTAALLSSLKASKTQHAGLIATITSAIKVISAPPSSLTLNVLGQVAGFAGIAISLWLLGIFAEAAARRYQTDRQLVLSSLSFTFMVLLIVPTALCGVLYYFVVYSFS